MRVDTAIELINGVMFFPGFKFEATDYTARFEGSIRVTIHYEAWNTNRESVGEDGQYTETIETYATFPLMVEDCQREIHLYRRLFSILMRLYEHEGREALRVKHTKWAPFHPHKQGGMRTWRETHPEHDIMLDLAPEFGFGI